MKINRGELLSQLEKLSPGLDQSGLIEQGDCFVFIEGRGLTYCEEVVCSIQTEFTKTITGAVEAKPLLAVLKRMRDEEIDVSAKEGELQLKGKGKACGIKMEAEIRLPINSLEFPDSWQELDSSFSEAIDVVKDCTSKDASRLKTSCVHVGPEYVEASDNFQLARWPITIPISRDYLIRQTSIRHVVKYKIDRIAESEAWLHFSDGEIVLSCRTLVETYPDFDAILAIDGDSVELPHDLDNSIDVASVFSSGDSGMVLIRLKKGKMQLEGVNDSGWYKEQMKVGYDGPEFGFAINPAILKRLVSKSHQCQIDGRKLVAQVGKFIYASCLTVVDEEKK